MASAEHDPVSDREAADLFAPLRDRSGVALAVSGGGDSSALLHLYRRALLLDPTLPRAVVLTVDHGLRPAAAIEAAEVARAAAALGLAHRTLVWGPHATHGNLQAEARIARRRLLLEACAASGCDALALAHHADDQAETFLARLARGSGVVGLAAMARERTEEGIRVFRPFLDLPKTRLVATLRAAGIAWVEDPSNADPRFERARLRAARPLLDGLGLDRARLVATARAMARAAVALDGIARELCGRALRFDDGGWATVAVEPFTAAPEEIRLRVLSRLIATIGRMPYGPRLARIEALDADIAAAALDRARVVRTLGGVRIELRRGFVWVAVEAGRAAVEASILAPGETGRRRGRIVRLSAEAPRAVEISALGAAGRRAITSAACPVRTGDRPVASAAVLETAPAAFVEGRVVACPALGFTAEGWAGAVWVESAPNRPGDALFGSLAGLR